MPTRPRGLGSIIVASCFGVGALNDRGAKGSDEPETQKRRTSIKAGGGNSHPTGIGARRRRFSKAAIEAVAGEIATRFRPERIVLFGSYAHGRPHAYSDIDLLVVMRTRNEIGQSVRILNALDSPLPLDLIVRSPENLRWQLAEDDDFVREVMEKGKLLYEEADRPVDSQSRSRSRHRRRSA